MKTLKMKWVFLGEHWTSATDNVKLSLLLYLFVNCIIFMSPFQGKPEGCKLDPSRGPDGRMTQCLVTDRPWFFPKLQNADSVCGLIETCILFLSQLLTSDFYFLLPS